MVLEQKFGTPKIVNDGVTVAREVELEDPVENIGAKLVRQVRPPPPHPSLSRPPTRPPALPTHTHAHTPCVHMHAHTRCLSFASLPRQPSLWWVRGFVELSRRALTAAGLG